MEEINDILAKHFSLTELTVNEKIIFDKWKVENLAEYNSLTKSWNSVPEFEYKEFNTESAWQNINDSIVEKEEKTTKIFSIKPYFKYAIAASVALIVAIGGFNLFGSSDETNFMAFENTTNKTKTLNLEDGSVIYVGKNTTIEYQNNFADNRNIKLDGEAFFDVHRDEQHPFIIETNYGNIEVLGTSFNINTKQQKTIVSVKSGIVELRNSTTKTKLGKNESASSDGKSISNTINVDINYLSWKTGEFKFDNTPLKTVVRQLNSFYKTNLKIANSVDKNQTINGEFNNQNLNLIVEAITLSCNLESEKQNNQIILK